MRRLPSLLFLLLFSSQPRVLEAAAPTEATTADWPQWRGPARDGTPAPGSIWPAHLPAVIPTLWKVKVGDGLASPVVAAGRLFLFDAVNGKETLHALEAATGSEVWREPVDERFQDEQGPPGPRCTPLVDGDRVYVQSCRGELQCRAVANGRLHWRTHFQKDFGAVLLGEDSKVPGAAEHGYTASPLLVGEQLIACVGGTNGAGIVSFDKLTGAVRWKSQDDLASYAAPILARLSGRDQILCFTVEGVIALAPSDGGLLWRVPLKTSYGRNVTTPVVVGNCVIVGSYQAGLVGIRVGAEGPGLPATRAWSNKAAAMNFSSPVTDGRLVYGLGPARNLIGVEPATGRIVWSETGLWHTSADAAHGAFIVLRSQLLITTDAGELILVAVDRTGVRSLGRTQVCGKNWCNPALTDGRLYLRDGLQKPGALYCLDLRPAQ